MGDLFVADFVPQPTNCRWATKMEQAGNKRMNVWIEYNGERMIISDWARRYNVVPTNLALMLRKGYSFEHSVTNLKKIN